MPSWNETLNQIQQEMGKGTPLPIALDNVRRNHLRALQEYTKRPTICYYSGWLQKPGLALTGVDDNDKNAFMATIYGLPKHEGLDLLLHTPGGDTAATESLVNYLRKIFGTDIRVFVPQIAMSAGTIIACAAKEIWMGKQSNIGPIDPQFRGWAAHGIIDEFARAVKEVTENPRSAPVWGAIIGKYHPTFLADCQHAIDMSAEMLKNMLVTGMYKDNPEANEKADRVVACLNNHTDTKAHNRHIHLEEAKDMGLNVKPLEDDNTLQDLVLTVHHAYMHTLAHTNVGKIVENHIGISVNTFVPGSAS